VRKTVKIPSLPFTVTDWAKLPGIVYPGETGTATWRTLTAGELRVRMVDYSPGYRADHWCARGHVVLVVAGEMETELKDGRIVTLGAGQGYMASDDDTNPHRAFSRTGCSLFIVD
jgi:hypothetical protein